MQTTEPDNETSSRNDECINFRPSPNFKHMKKYLKSKFDEEVTAAAMNAAADVPKIEASEVKNVSKVIQPPLPPHPPPPDVPIVNIKQEIDDDYQFNTAADLTDLNNSGQSYPKTDQPMVTKTEPIDTRIMCRNFARGNCRKGASCIYVHEIIKSQLDDVFTFCKNFQNKKCFLPKCRFVHATIFEKEYYYRTGYLPPHTTAHTNQIALVPPPPPPLRRPKEIIQTVPEAYTSTPSYDSIRDSSVAPPPVISCNTTFAPPAMTTSTTEEIYRVPEATPRPQKREWSDSDEFSRSPGDIDFYEPPAKKCTQCDTNELRYKFSKNKMEKMVLSSEESEQKAAILNRKHQRLTTVLMTLFKPMGNTNNNPLGLSLNLGGEKDQIMPEAVLNTLLSTSRMSFTNEDNRKNILSNLNF